METYTIITGATSGIGLDLSKRLAKEKNVILVGRSQEKVDMAISQVGGSSHALGFVCDLNYDRRNVATRLSEFLVSNSIQVDSFVHCAGTSKVMAIRQSDADSVDTVFLSFFRKLCACTFEDPNVKRKPSTIVHNTDFFIIL